MDIDPMVDNEESITASTDSSSDGENDTSETHRRRAKKRANRPDEGFGLETDPECRARATHAENVQRRFNSEAWEMDFKLEIIIELVKQWCIDHQHQGLPRSTLALADSIYGLTNFRRYVEASAVLMNLVLNQVITLDPANPAFAKSPQLVRLKHPVDVNHLRCFEVYNGNVVPDDENSNRIGWDFKLALLRSYHFFTTSCKDEKDCETIMPILVDLCTIEFSVDPMTVLHIMLQRGLLALGRNLSPNNPHSRNFEVSFPLLNSHSPQKHVLGTVMCRNDL